MSEIKLEEENEAAARAEASAKATAAAKAGKKAQLESLLVVRKAKLESRKERTESAKQQLKSAEAAEVLIAGQIAQFKADLKKLDD